MTSTKTTELSSAQHDAQTSVKLTTHNEGPSQVLKRIRRVNARVRTSPRPQDSVICATLTRVDSTFWSRGVHGRRRERRGKSNPQKRARAVHVNMPVESKQYSASLLETCLLRTLTSAPLTARSKKAMRIHGIPIPPPQQPHGCAMVHRGPVLRVWARSRAVGSRELFPAQARGHGRTPRRAPSPRARLVRDIIHL